MKVKDLIKILKMFPKDAELEGVYGVNLSLERLQEGKPAISIAEQKGDVPTGDTTNV